MTLPLSGLVAAAVRALAHVGARWMALKAAVGNRRTVGPRDAPATPGPLAGRLDRSLGNHAGSATAFVAPAAAIARSGRGDGLTGAGILGRIAGRAACRPADALAVPLARAAARLVATGGLAPMAVGIVPA